MNKDKGSKKHLSISMDEFTDALAEVLYRKGYKEIVTFDEIVQYAIEERKVNPQIGAFVVSVKKNFDPQNENDKLIIIQGMLDGNSKPLFLDGKESESRIIHTRTIDKKFLDMLNGADTRIIRF